jgi:hypothetical protein
MRTKPFVLEIKNHGIPYGVTPKEAQLTDKEKVMMAEAQKIFDIARMFGFIVSEHK